MQILLPLKEFAAAKQRLSGLLSAPERAQLFEAMVEDVLLVLTRNSAVENIAICSRDQAARWLANYYGVEFIDEAKLPARDLNTAVNAAVRQLYARGENDVVVVHGDLPMLSASDLCTFLDAHRESGERAMTIATDRRGAGTNLLAWRALPNFVATYGENSFQRHRARARALNIEPTVCDLPSARGDIDEPEDLLLLLQSAPAAALKSLLFLRESGIASRLLAMQREAGRSGGGGERERA